jgi:DNA-binding CsgD family transcriptional regulator
MTLISSKLEAVALMNEGKTNPEIAEAMNIKLPQVAYLLNQARQDGFKIGRNHSVRERERNKARRYV